jgi:hypothetical protein
MTGQATGPPIRQAGATRLIAQGARDQSRKLPADEAIAGGMPSITTTRPITSVRRAHVAHRVSTDFGCGLRLRHVPRRNDATGLAAATPSVQYSSRAGNGNEGYTQCWEFR